MIDHIAQGGFFGLDFAVEYFEMIGRLFDLLGCTTQAHKAVVEMADLAAHSLRRIALGVHRDKDGLDFFGLRTECVQRVAHQQ